MPRGAGHADASAHLRVDDRQGAADIDHATGDGSQAE